MCIKRIDGAVALTNSVILWLSTVSFTRLEVIDIQVNATALFGCDSQGDFC